MAYGHGTILGSVSGSNGTQVRSQYAAAGGTLLANSKQLNSTSIVRQKTSEIVINSQGIPQKKTPITQMQGHTPVSAAAAMGHGNAIIMHSGPAGTVSLGNAGKEKK